MSKAILAPENKDGSRFTTDLVLWDVSYRVGDHGEGCNAQGYANAPLELHKMDTPDFPPSRTTGDRHLKFYETRDNLRPPPGRCEPARRRALRPAPQWAGRRTLIGYECASR